MAKQYILSGTVNPTSSAVNADKGTLYLNLSTAQLFQKQDSGLTTNWTAVGGGGPTVSNITANNNDTLPTSATYVRADPTPGLLVEIDTATAVPDVGGNLAGTYYGHFITFSPSVIGSFVYYPWYKVGGVGSDPGAATVEAFFGIGTAIPIEVDIATNSSANAVASATRAAITAALISSNVTVSGVGADITLTNTRPGTIAPDLDGGAPTGFSFVQNQAGTNSITLSPTATFAPGTTVGQQLFLECSLGNIPNQFMINIPEYPTVTTSNVSGANPAVTLKGINFIWNGTFWIPVSPG